MCPSLRQRNSFTSAHHCLQVRSGRPERLRVGDVRPRDQVRSRDDGQATVRRRRKVFGRAAISFRFQFSDDRVSIQRRVRRDRFRGNIRVLRRRPRYTRNKAAVDLTPPPFNRLFQ